MSAFLKDSEAEPNMSTAQTVAAQQCGVDKKALLAAFRVNHHPDAEPSSVEIAKLSASITTYLSAPLPEDAAELVAEMTSEDFRHEMQHLRSSSEIDMLFQQAASLIQSQAARIAGLEAGLAEALRLLGRYRTETPLGNQPHMIALEAETFAASARALLNGERKG